MTEPGQILEASDSVVLVDWPSKDVPETLAHAGFAVFVKGGPAPDHFSSHELIDGEIVVRRVGHAPDHADLVYAHRPLEELPGIIALARQVGAKAVWCQSGVTSTGGRDPTACWVPEGASREARAMVEATGLTYIDDTYIGDAVRRLNVQK